MEDRTNRQIAFEIAKGLFDVFGVGEQQYRNHGQVDVNCGMFRLDLPKQSLTHRCGAFGVFRSKPVGRLCVRV
jgi:hypothetical protein